MKPLAILVMLSTLAFSTLLQAEVWHVGPSQQHKVPSAVTGLVKDGDEV